MPNHLYRAARLEWPETSVDFHISNSTLEHIPPEALAELLQSAHRMLKPAGLAAYHIDNPDHSANGNPCISRVNFLQFEVEEWLRRYGNSKAYLNRLRT